jgi:nucleoside-diphosphate-sugar epimerase
MKIAIIGGNSFLGKQLFLRLLNANKDASFHIFGSNIEEKYLTAKAVTFHKYIFPKISLDNKLLSTFDAIYFCSATGVQSNIIATEEMIYGLNAFEPVKVAIELEKNNFKGKFVTFGSYFEIGTNSIEKSFTENEVVFAQGSVPNHYCNSKRMLSRFVSGNLLKIHWFHFILPTIYGPTENSMRLIPYLINGILSKRPLKVTSGTQLRQYIHIDDVIDLITMIIFKDFKAGIFNVAPGNTISIKNLIDTVFQTINHKSVEVEITTRVDENMKFLALDARKVEQEFKWKSQIDLVDGIRTYLENDYR